MSTTAHQQRAHVGAASPQKELWFRIALLCCLIYALNSFLWIYTGGNNYVLSAAESAIARYYSYPRYLLFLYMAFYILYKSPLDILIDRTWPILLVCFFFMISVLWSSDFRTSMRSYIVFFMQILTGIALCLRGGWADIRRRLRWIAIALLIVNAVFSALFFDLATHDEPPLAGLLRGIFPSKNNLGQNISVLFAILLLTSLHRGRFEWSIGTLFGLGLAAALLILSGSATSWVASLLILALLCFHQGFLKPVPRIGYRVMVLLALVAIGFAFVALLPIVLEELFALLGRDITFTGRTTLWEFAWSHLQGRMFTGFGFETFWRQFLTVDPEDSLLRRAGLWDVGQAHNGFLEAFLHGGVIGFVLTLWLFLYLIVKSLASIVRDPEDDAMIFVFCTTMQGIAHNLTESSFPASIHITGIMITIGVILVRVGERKRRQAFSQYGAAS